MRTITFVPTVGGYTVMRGTWELVGQKLISIQGVTHLAN